MKWKGFMRQSCWICLLILGIVANISAKENSPRRWSVRKTGEFGRRVSAEITTTELPQELQLPTKQFRLHEPNLQVAETRRYDQFFGSVRKPSQSLQLPKFEGSDQEAQETADEDGYAYAKPDDPEGYQYNDPDPIVADPPAEQPEPAVPQPPLPGLSNPDLVAGPGDAVIRPLTDTQIDADSLRPQRTKPALSSPQVSAFASSDHSDSGGSCTDDNDPNCWPHGYTGAIPGEAGTDYPILSEIVPTNFNCDDQQFSGYYADTDERARCQVFHVCLKGNNRRRTRQWSFLCPNGTIYSQNDFVCVWWADAPECNEATVRSLYSLNEQLGWDNVTEGSSSSSSSSSRRNTNFRSGNRNSNLESLESAMSALSPASASSSSAASSRNSAFASSAIPTTYRPSSHSKGTQQQASSARTALPYRVPVKVGGEKGRARTKLQEVTQNALHGAAHELDYGDDTEHDVDESANFETTSLRQQSESRHKSKTASALRKSTSEAYEQKEASEGIQPLVVNRPGGGGGSTGGVAGQTELPSPGEYDGGEENPSQVVMMPSLQRYPDGSEGYAEVPVMFPHGTDASEGYRYPTPTQGTSTPGPTYLPPFNQYASAKETISTTTENYPTPTIPTEPPLENENYEADYQSTTTEQPSTTTERSGGYRYTDSTTTDQADGYRYPDPTTTEKESGYQYPNPQAAEQESGYQYPAPQKTDQEEGYQYPNPQKTDKEEAGYRYPRPARPQKTDKEEAGYRYPTPTSTEKSARLRNTNTIPTTTEPSTGYNYPNPQTTEEESGYKYPNPQTTDQESGYNYPNPQTTEEESGYNYPTPTTEKSGRIRYTNANNPTTTTEQPTSYSYPDSTTTDQNAGYRYTDSTTTEQSGGYQYTDSSTTTEPNAGYRFTDSTTTEQPEGYVYKNPTTTERSSNYRYTNPSTTPATTVQTTTITTSTGEVDENAAGYQYAAPNQKEQLIDSGYSYPTPTSTTTEQPTTTTNLPTQGANNEDYQVTGNDITDVYQTETTRFPETPKPVYGVPDSQSSTFNTERSQDLVSTTPGTTTTNEIPVGGYLPPKSNEVVVDDAKQVVDDEGGDEDDTVNIDGDYEDEENEVTDTTGPAAAEEGGYGYHLPTPPSSNPIVLNGGNLDSDEKLNEILRQIQNGGIEAVDSTGKPIAFSQLKNLLLNSPRGAVELQGEVDSVTSSSTEVPASPQKPPQQQEQEQPTYFNTITTATILPNNNNNNNLLFTNQQSGGAIPSPSGFYLPPNSNNNNNNQQSQQQQYYSLSNNVQTQRPNYEIKLPNREFESHSVVEANAIDTTRNNINNNNNNAFTQSQYQSGNTAFTTSTVANIQQVQPPQQQQGGRQVQYEEVKIPFTSSQNQQAPQTQQQFFSSQQSYSSSSLSLEPTPTTVVIPNGNYLPPRQQQDFERQSLLTNLVVPATQPQQQQQQPQRFVSNENLQTNNNYPPPPPKPEGQYLPPPRQTSSILQSQFYTGEASNQNNQHVSQPIQLNENLQLQQSFSIPLPPQGAATNTNNNNNNDRTPGVKDIKIVPALFVHQHTSVASQSEQQQRIQGNIIENVFQTLEASPSTYLPSVTGGSSSSSSTTTSRFGTRNSLAQQLNQIASNSANLPQASVGRQFTRRSNGNGGSVSSSSSSSSSVTIEKAPPVSTFTLEDARTPDELQKYHHQDLKRFHKENIATHSVLDESSGGGAQLRSTSATIALGDRASSSHNNNRNTHRTHNIEESNRGSRRGNSGDGGSRSSSSSSSSSKSNSSNNPNNRFSISSTSILESGRGNGGSEDFFIPVSGSFGSGGGGSSSKSRSTRSRGSSSSRSGRGFLDSESETTLLRRFEEEGGFGSRLL